MPFHKNEDECEGETIVISTSFSLSANETARAAERAAHIPEKPEPAIRISFVIALFFFFSTTTLYGDVNRYYVFGEKKTCWLNA